MTQTLMIHKPYSLNSVFPTLNSSFSFAAVPLFLDATDIQLGLTSLFTRSLKYQYRQRKPHNQAIDRQIKLTTHKPPILTGRICSSNSNKVEHSWILKYGSRQ